MYNFAREFEKNCPILHSYKESPHLAGVFNLIEALNMTQSLVPQMDFRRLGIERGAKVITRNKHALLIGGSLLRQLKSTIAFEADHSMFFEAAVNIRTKRKKNLESQSEPLSQIFQGYSDALDLALAEFYEKELLPNAKEALDRLSIMLTNFPNLAKIWGVSIAEQNNAVRESLPSLSTAIDSERLALKGFYRDAVESVLICLLDGFLDAYTPEGIDWALSKERRDSDQSSSVVDGSLDLGAHFAPWVYGPALTGDINCLEKTKRRLQAYAVYGILFEGIVQPGISKLIDEGKPIEMPLRDIFGLNGHQMRFVKEVATRADLLNSLRGTPQTTRVITMMAASGVPIANWPEVFSQFNTTSPCVKGSYLLWHDPWETRFSLTRGLNETHRTVPKIYGEHCVSLLPEVYWKFLPDEVTTDAGNSFQDACHDLERDILWPSGAKPSGAARSGESEALIEAALYAHINHPITEKGWAPPFMPTGPASAELHAAARAYYTAVHSAIVGEKTRSGFRKALLELHKFAPSIAAKRREILGAEEKWPALFEPWRSADGNREIIFLTSSSSLVEEGLRMRHCVGSYDQRCALGKTHIASVKVDGEHRATLEMHVAFDPGRNKLILKKGQFAGLLNAPPPRGAQKSFAEFMRDVAAQRWRPNVTEVVAHIKKKNSGNRYSSYSGNSRHRPFLLKDAEGLWPIYRATIITSYPEAKTLQEWRKVSGIENALKRLNVAAQRARQELAYGTMDENGVDAQRSIAPVVEVLR